MTDARTVAEQDGRVRLGAQLLTTAVLLAAFAVGSALQQSILAAVGDPVGYAGDRAPERLLANVAGCAVILCGIAVRPVARLPWTRAIAPLLVAVAAGGGVRVLVLLAFKVHSPNRLDLALLDSVAPAVTTTLSVAVGLAIGESVRRMRAQQRAGFEQAMRAARALDALEREDLRVRREVAQGLHGTLQQHLVLLSARLGHVRTALAPGTEVRREDADELAGLSAQIDQIREGDVRTYSRLLFPSGVEMGLAPAIRALFRRVDTAIAVHVDIDESVAVADDPGTTTLDTETRLLAIRVLEEGVSNALRHGRAASLAVDATVETGRDQDRLLLRLDDDGTGALAPPPHAWNGLALLQTLLEARGGTLSLGARPEGGMRLSATLPLPRPTIHAVANTSIRDGGAALTEAVASPQGHQP